MSEQPSSEVAPELREALLTQLTCHLYKVRGHDEVVQVLASPLAESAGLTASLHFALGLAHFELKQWREAAEHMRQCLVKRKQPALSPINTDILTAAPHHCLALSLVRLRDADGAEKAFQSALAETGRTEEVKLDYARFLAEHNRPLDAVHKVHELVAQNSRCLAAWRLGGEIALGRPEFLEFARDWTGEAMRYQAEDPVIAAQRAEALMLSGDTAEAAGLWERIWNSEHQPKALAALILCESVESQTARALEDAGVEKATSLAFVEWYQKLLTARMQTVVGRLNEQVEILARTLPTAAKIIESAIAQSAKPESTAICA
jgi:tetratricopeptide (TPR) repeat protein